MLLTYPISKLYGSLLQLHVCVFRHRVCRGLYITAWINLVFVEMGLFCIHSSEWLLSKLHFAESSEENVLKWKIWHCYFLKNFVAHTMIFFLNFCDQNWVLYRKNNLDFEKKAVKHCSLQFLEWNAYTTTQFTTHLTNTLLWSGYG
mgnify:CR=1 FL=1